MQKRFEEMSEWTRQLMNELTEEVRDRINARKQKLGDDEVLALIEEVVLHESRSECCTYSEKADLICGIFNATRRELGLLQPYAENENISEIMVNGIDHIFVERNGKIERVPQKFESAEDLEELIRRLAARVHREINELNPIVDARLEDGARVNAVYKNVALNGPVLTIRRFPEKGIGMEALLECGTLTSASAEFLKKAVQGGLNLFVSGGTSSGKTTFLNVLSDYIPKEERVILIEDSAELQFNGVENLVRLETKNANVQGKGCVSLRQLIRTSLRMRPDRIIVGEVRGEEVVDMVQAQNSGHSGSMCTGHGNSTEGMLYRLEAMFLTAADFPIESVRGQIAEAIDLMIHMGRMPDKSRKVLEITEIVGYEDGKIQRNPLFMYRNGEGLVPTGNRLQNRTKLELKGVCLNDGL